MSTQKNMSFSAGQSKPLGQILLEITDLKEEELESALSQNAKAEIPMKIGSYLLQRKLVTEDQLLRALCIQLDLPFYNKLPIQEIDPALVKGLTIQFCRDHKVLPIARDLYQTTVVVSDPLNIFPMDDLRLILGSSIGMGVAPEAVIDMAINRVFERAGDSQQGLMDELNENQIGGDEDLEETRDLLESSDGEGPIIRLVNGLLARSVRERASDIHIEPYEKEVMVRFRIDGTLSDKMHIPKRHMATIATRIKILGKLNIAEKRIPQDGRISIKVAGKDIDVRLSTLPTAHGERIVMRLLDKSSGAPTLAKTGMSDQMYAQYTSLVEQKHGIVFVTGPTGSGKSTLLYASLMHINKSDINILTIEDPVEYQVNGIGQTEVKDKVGMTFGAGLRAILRQDPDVIMIGEIRDSETAQIAVQASMTGHLVLSTVHTNDTASTVTRMMDFNIEPFQLSSALLGVVATRLLRRLCTSCRVDHVPTERELETMGKTPTDIAGKTIYKAGAGCEKCIQSGYSGRVGVYELLVLDDDLKELIVRTQDANVIKKKAVEKGMMTLRDSAIDRVLAGITSIDEAINKTQTEEIDIEAVPAVPGTPPSPPED